MFGFGRSKNKYADRGWVENIVPGAQMLSTDKKPRGDAEHLGSSLPVLAASSLIIFFILIILVFVGRLFFLQIISHEKYRALSDRNRERVSSIRSERGLIFDRLGRPLTENIPKLSLALVPQNLPASFRDVVSREQFIRRISGISDRDTTEIRRYIRERVPAILRDNLDYDDALTILIEIGDLPGVEIIEGSRRRYLYGASDAADFEEKKISSLSHIIGYEGKVSEAELGARRAEGYLPTDSIGKSGVERFYEKNLRGSYGVRRREVDNLEREQKVISEIPPVPGEDLYLTLDLELQSEVEKILREEMARVGVERAAAVALDPNSGEVLALVSLPSFDNNDFSGGISFEKYNSYLENENHPLFHRAVAGTYPSGSTAKIAVAAGALHENIVSPSTIINSRGGIEVGDRFFPDWQPGGHGNTNLRRSLASSVNTYYYYVGGGFEDFKGLGSEKLAEHLRVFGFGERLGLDSPGEASGLVPTPEWKKNTLGEQWYIGDTYNLSIGQGQLLVTPLQVAAMTAAVATDGELYRPRLAYKFRSFSGADRLLSAEKIRDLPYSSATLREVRLGMRDCVLSGSCRALSNLPITVAGKTGTAQWNTNRKPHAWFTSFAPFNNAEVVFTVLLEEGEEGSANAVPVARRFYEYWVSR